MIEETEWGEYKLGDLFEIENTLSFNADSLVDGEDYDYVTRTSTNQGILRRTGFVNAENINPSGTWSLGLLQMDFFYRQRPWYAGQFVRRIVPKIEISPNAALFFSVVLNKLKGKLLAVLVRNVDTVFKDSIVRLPIKDKQINFSFMEKFIAEMKLQYFSELETYLDSSKLKNYFLTPAEENALNFYDELEWASYNLEELFGQSTRGKRLKSADRIPGPLPFVTAGEAEEGVSAYIGNDVEIFSQNTTTIDMFGSAKYRNYQYGGDDHIAVVHTESLPKGAAIFVTAAIHKSSHNGQFNYGKNFYAKDADALNILLPAKCGEPDYPYMELLISAVHKLVIKDVVAFTNQKVQAANVVVDK